MENKETNDKNLNKLLKKKPNLNKTFEYISYSNKFRNVLIDLSDFMKLFAPKLEALKNFEVDVTNIDEFSYFNSQVKDLIHTAAMNLSHMEEKLNKNELSFLNFAQQFISYNIINSEQRTPKNSTVYETSLFSDLSIDNYNHGLLSSNKTKIPITKNVEISKHIKFKIPNAINTKISNRILTDNSDTNVFDSANILLSLSDDQIKDQNYHDKVEQILIEITSLKNNYQDFDYFVKGPDKSIISSDLGRSNDLISLSIENGQTLSTSRHLIYTSQVLKVQPNASEITILTTRMSDYQLRSQINERYQEKNNIFTKLNYKSKDIVLDFDVDNKKPLVIIQSKISKKMMKYQIEGIRFIWDIVFESVDLTNKTNGTGCIIAHRMGTGKTLQIIALIHSILSCKEINTKKILILCPSELIDNWMIEMAEWLKYINADHVFEVLRFIPKEYNISKLNTWKSNGGVFILSYQDFKVLVNHNSNNFSQIYFDELINPGPDIVILDEAHIIINDFQLLKFLSEIRTKRRIALTGIITQNTLHEYYTLINFVKPYLLGNFEDFSSKFIKPITSGQSLEADDTAVKIMKERIFVLHRLLLNSYNYIYEQKLRNVFPTKFEHTIEVGMTPFQCELYNAFLTFISDIKTSVEFQLHVLSLITLHPLSLFQLLNIKNSKQTRFEDSPFKKKLTDFLNFVNYCANDPRFFEATQSNKIVYVLNMIDLCEKQNEKIVCFLKSPLALDVMEFFLQKEKNWKIGINYYRMDINTPIHSQLDMCQDFNDYRSRIKLLILIAGVGPLGCSLIGAHRVLLLDLFPNPTCDLHAINSCMQLGQKNVVFVNRILSGGTFEPKIYYQQMSKLGVTANDLYKINKKLTCHKTKHIFKIDLSQDSNDIPLTITDTFLNCLIAQKIGCISDVLEHDSTLGKSIDSQLSSSDRGRLWSLFKKNSLTDKLLSDHLKLKQNSVDNLYRNFGNLMKFIPSTSNK